MKSYSRCAQERMKIRVQTSPRSCYGELLSMVQESGAIMIFHNRCQQRMRKKDFPYTYRSMYVAHKHTTYTIASPFLPLSPRKRSSEINFFVAFLMWYYSLMRLVAVFLQTPEFIVNFRTFFSGCTYRSMRLSANNSSTRTYQYIQFVGMKSLCRPNVIDVPETR